MFLDESKEHLQTMNENLLALENSPQDIGIVQNIFRAAHTLKGMSATMGFEDLAQLTHEMENVLDLVRNSKLEMNEHIFDCLFQSFDALEGMVADIEQGGTGKADVSAIVASLKAIVSGDAEKPGQARNEAAGEGLDAYQFSVLSQSLEMGNNVFHIVVSVRDDCVLKAARAYMVFDLLERNGEVIKATPPVEDIEQEKFEKTFSVYYVSKSDGKELESRIANISEIESVRVAALDSETLKRHRAEAGAAGSSEKRAESPSGDAGAASARAETAAARQATAAKAAAAPAAGTAASRTIRVDIDRLDKLMNLLSELLIDRVRLEQLASEVKRSDLSETVEHMARLSSELQNIVLKLRMVPVDTVFSRFPRMIRDIAKNLDKKIELVITGAETELDRTVIDEIGDPLVHMLRNAADHGLEPAQERIAAGKSETGTIHLRAFHSGNHVFIEVEDDGRGINREKVLQKAIKNGLVSAEQAGKMTDQDVYRLLFTPGFSTAEQVSDLSGRGVGLDVVITKITALGGHVDVQSTPGRGTKYSIQLPLTLSIIAAMLIKVGDEKYAIPLSSIVEAISVKRSEIRHVHGNRMVDYRSNVIPLVSLRQVFDVPSENGTERPESNMVIIRKGDKMAALEVDDLIGQQEIVLKSLGKYLTRLFAISGATILGDGQVALIIDTNALVKS
jgi:two-component system chemotaxis sensor kinase CheA